MATQWFNNRNDNIEELNQFLRKVLQVVLYVCTINADVKPNSEQKTITKRSTTGVIRDRYAEIRKWDVGVRVGSAVRKFRQTKQTNSVNTERQGSHSPKRPHIRRGHWHHYWTGKLSDVNARKLVLKWTAPIYVGIDDTDDSPAVIHPVKS